MRIGEHIIGPGEPVYVVAEIGGNHDGSLDQAYWLIDAAADAGADAAKFQLFNPDTLYPGRHTPGSFDPDWLSRLSGRCALRGIHFLCSVFDAETLAAYLSIHPVALKIASPEALNIGFLREVYLNGGDVPLIVSTGAMSEGNVDSLNETLAEFGRDYALLHCVSAYPAATDSLNLRVIQRMAYRYDIPVGFSDHTNEVGSAAIAVAAGAQIIEKHLTLDQSLPGPDHSFALEMERFMLMVQDVRGVEGWLGDGVKRVMPSEDPLDRRVAA